MSAVTALRSSVSCETSLMCHDLSMYPVKLHVPQLKQFTFPCPLPLVLSVFFLPETLT